VTLEGSPFDPLASAYDAWFEEEGRLVFATEVRAFQEVLPPLERPWLEVGVGSGRFAQALSIGTGIDPSTRLLDMARRRGISAFVARGEDEFFAEASFGTVFVIATLCFVQSPLVVLQQAHRVLKPGGKVVLGLVLRHSPWGRFYLARKNEGHRFYRYATFYGYHEVTRLLEQSGFAVDRVVSTLFQGPGEVTKVEEPRPGFSLDAGFTIVVANRIAGAGKLHFT
jgi:SAM-dependent methyltransferase